MEKFITGEIDREKFSAFVTSNKPLCKDGEHQWDGDEIMTFHNDSRELTRTQFDNLPQDEQDKLNPSSGCVTCSKCGISYLDYDNPNYL